VRLITLPVQIPAVGNIDAVRTWRLGRIEQAIQTGDHPDILLEIRGADGQVVRTVGPAAQLVELARRSNWFDDVKQRPSRDDYVERQIAFDLDPQNRLIAVASLEPTYRDRNRLRRALGVR
jgi:hypothetical protein